MVARRTCQVLRCLEIQVIVSCWTCVLGTKFQTSTKTAMIQNYWAIPSTLLQNLVTFLFSQGLEYMDRWNVEMIDKFAYLFQNTSFNNPYIKDHVINNTIAFLTWKFLFSWHLIKWVSSVVILNWHLEMMFTHSMAEFSISVCALWE